jgi:hypothetical protein
MTIWVGSLEMPLNISYIYVLLGNVQRNRKKELKVKFKALELI